MGSVPDLYTTGDNDPEITPVAYYRHYLYCDACGSFELSPWMAPSHHQALERARRWLGMVALISLPLLVLVPAWLALGLVPSPSILLVLVGGLAWTLVVVGLYVRFLAWLLPWGNPESPSALGPVAPKWRFVKRVLPWLVGVVVVEWLANVLLSPTVVLLAGVVLIVGLLVARALLGSKIEVLGLRCRPCQATYAYGTPFFTALDANPKNLTIADVPRPLGVSPFEQGEFAAPEPEARTSSP